MKRICPGTMITLLLVTLLIIVHSQLQSHLHILKSKVANTPIQLESKLSMVLIKSWIATQ